MKNVVCLQQQKLLEPAHKILEPALKIMVQLLFKKKMLHLFL